MLVECTDFTKEENIYFKKECDIILKFMGQYKFTTKNFWTI